MLLADGQSLKYISDQLGHSGVRVTADVYSHVLDEVRTAAMAALDAGMAAGTKR